MNEPTITFAGNLTADPEIRFTPTGRAVTHLGVMCTPRRQDPTGVWVDGISIYWACQAWGGLGEHAADSLHKGDRVLVTGRVRANVWTPTDGLNARVEQKRLEVLVDEVGPSLRFATTKVTRATRSSDGPGAASQPASATAGYDEFAQQPY